MSADVDQMGHAAVLDLASRLRAYGEPPRICGDSAMVMEGLSEALLSARAEITRLRAEAAAAAEAMREAAAQWHDEAAKAAHQGTGGTARHQWMAAQIRALPLPAGADALAAARREVWEQAAKVAEGWCCNECRLVEHITDEIRARAQEDGDA